MARSPDPALAERRRRQILDAAIACFRRRGFHQTSMQEICAEAALSAGALYRYFPSKAEIIAAIADRVGDEREPLYEAIAGGANVVESLCALAEGAIERAGESCSLTAEIIAEAMRDPALTQRFASKDAREHRKLSLALAAAQRGGRVRLAMPAQRAAGVLMLMLDGLTLRAAALGAAGARPLLADFRAAAERLILPPVRPIAARRTSHALSAETDR
jgi:TetR/AcrR family transcriptional regulator, repressor for uid operon